MPLRRSPGSVWPAWPRPARWRGASAALLLALLALDQALPPPLPPTDRGMRVTAADGTPLRTFPGADGRWRQAVAPEQVSPLYLQAVLGYEDRWFYWHPGINPLALLRAGWQWARGGRVVSGGSTLTMQVARILEPPPAGPQPLAARLRAKARQLARALQLELRLSKREILTLYLDHAPMGGIVEGVEMASRAYLGHAAASLSPAEAALLAALPQAPSRRRPDRAPAAAQAARDKVLQRLADQGLWTDAQLHDARTERVAVQAIRGQWLAPLAAERLRQLALARRHPPGQPVRSTLDAELQSTVERLLLDRADALPPKVSMAVLVMDNDTLALRAYAGSADFNDNTRAAHVDMARGVRSPGSTLKPFLYAMALDDGLIHAQSLLIDAPQSFSGYQPGNFQAAFSGPVSAAEALQKSLNVPAVDLLDRVGPARFAAQLRAAGVRLRLERGAEPNLSLILGGAGTTLEELVGAYRALARGGLAGRPRLMADDPTIESRLMSEGAAFIVRDILEGGGHPERPFGDHPRALAWKTGTSFGFRDAWALGVTDRFTLGVWVGRPDGTPNPGYFGANIAAPLLHDIAAVLPVAPARPPRPASVQAVLSCWPLGLRLSATEAAHCEQRHSGWALDGAVPPTLPDRDGGAGLLLAGGACAGGNLRPAQVRWPSALAPWRAALAPWRASPAPRRAMFRPSRDGPPPAGCAGEAGAAALRIVGLDDGSVLRAAPGQRQVDVGLSAQGGQAPGAGGPGALPAVYWLVDGEQQSRTRAGESWTLRLRQPGRHTITALDGQGRYQRIDVTVTGL